MFDMTVLLQVFQWENLLLCFLGTLFGIVVGAIPGLNGAVGVSLLLPITYSMSPLAGVLMLGGIYMGGMYGGSITAILLNVPGDVVAVCTAAEGYPLTLKGRAKEALYYSIFASAFGGFLGILALIFFTPPLAKIALSFGPPEMFLTALCGLMVVGSLSGNSLPKSLFAVSFGLFLGTIGMDRMSTAYRMTFGLDFLRAGISVVPLCLGFFCFAEVFSNVGNSRSNQILYKDQKITRREVIVQIIKRPILFLRSALIGILVGILPGIGGSMAVFVSYGEAKRSSKHPEEYGHGSTEGIIAAESANNALVGGALVPLLALGVPGSPVAAILACALTMQGIVGGPDLFVLRPDVAYSFLYGMMLTVGFMLLIGAFGIKYFSYILKPKMKYITPIVLAFAIFGAYSINNSVSEVFIAIFFGLLGVCFRHFEIPVSPVIIGATLSSLIELNLRRTLQMASATDIGLASFFLKRPISVVLMVVVAVFFVMFFLMKGKKEKERQQ